MIEIPADLQGNDRDRRGLPIPFVVYRDTQGVPHFSINNVVAVDRVLDEKLCGLCGKPLLPREIWLIGGPGSSFMDDGMYIDPWMHEACGRYAIEVCPFLAAPSYARRVEGRTLKQQDAHDDLELHDNRIAPPRPQFFVLSRTTGFTLVDSHDGSGHRYILPDRPWSHVEFWKDTAPITPQDARKLALADGFTPSELKWWPA
jgi:hypothetical protein